MDEAPLFPTPGQPREPATHLRRRRALVGLATAPELSLESRHRLALELDRLLDPRPGPVEAVASARRGPASLEAGVAAVADDARIDETLERAAEAGIELVTSVDPAYPPSLRDLELPPPCLFVRRLEGSALDSAAIGVVGPRNADPHALASARIFAREFACEGLAVVSGFARGVDAEAHREAARQGGVTLAVLGCGVDVPYPRQNQGLVTPVLEAGGALVSEFPPGTAPRPWHFPVRNRLIAALSTAVLVVQASARSGSLITARHALELGREVHAIPGRLTDSRARGANELLRDGAHVALDPLSVMETLPLRLREELRRRRLGAERDALRHSILRALARETDTAEGLAARLAVPARELLAALGELELSGEIVRGPDGWGPARRER